MPLVAAAVVLVAVAVMVMVSSVQAAAVAILVMVATVQTARVAAEVAFSAKAEMLEPMAAVAAAAFSLMVRQHRAPQRAVLAVLAAV